MDSFTSRSAGSSTCRPWARWRTSSRASSHRAASSLVLDLSKLTFLDSTGLRCLVSADQRAKDGGRRVVLVRGPDPVQRVFAITRLEDRLEMVDDAAAINADD